MSARALHEFTDLLPLLDISGTGRPAAGLGRLDRIGDAVGALLRAPIGAVRQLIAKLAGDDQPLVVLTGGGGPAVAGLLGRSVQSVPHLTLSGIALAGEATGQRRITP